MSIRTFWRPGVTDGLTRKNPNKQTPIGCVCVCIYNHLLLFQIQTLAILIFLSNKC